MSSVEALLQEALSEIPPGENGYLFLAGFIRRQLYPPQPESFKIQLIVCSIFLAVTLLLVFAVLFVRVYRGLQLAPFRLIKTPRGTLLAPQNLMTFSICIGVWLILAQAYIWVTIATAVDLDSLPSGLVLLKCVSWLPLWLCAAHEAWGITCVDALNKSNSPYAFWKWPLFINTFFPALIVFGCIMIGVLFHFASLEFESSYQDLLAMVAALEADASKGTAISLDVLLPLFPLGDSMITHINQFVSWFRAGWICWAVIIFAPLPVYTLCARAHLSRLAAQIRSIRRQNRPLSLSLPHGETTPSTVTGDSSISPSNGVRLVLFPWRSANADSKHQTLAGAYYRLVITGTLVFVLTVYYTGLTAFIAIRPRWIFNTVEGVQVQALAGLYPITVPGMLVTVFILIRSLQSPRPQAGPPGKSSSGLDSRPAVGGGTTTREELGLRVAIPEETIHIKTSGSPISSYAGSNEKLPLPLRMLNTSPTSASTVQVPVLPHMIPGYQSPASSPASTTRSQLPRVFDTPYRFGRNAAPRSPPELDEKLASGL